MRILITGSRAWSDYKTIQKALAHHIPNDIDPADVVVVHGAARGADELAGIFSKSMGYTVEEHPANWDSCGDDCDETHWRYREGKPYCPRAGFKRNSLMVSLGADICLAFIRNGSKGALMTAKLAEKAGIPVHRYILDDE